MAKGQRQRTGLAGEHYVAAELLQRGWNAALTYGNTQRTDVLAERGGDVPQADHYPGKGETDGRRLADARASRSCDWRVRRVVPLR